MKNYYYYLNETATKTNISFGAWNVFTYYECNRIQNGCKIKTKEKITRAFEKWKTLFLKLKKWQHLSFARTRFSNIMSEPSTVSEMYSAVT